MSDPSEIPRIGSDPDAFERFYREHVEAVQRFVARRVADSEQAADLTSDIFLAVLDSAGGYTPRRGAPIAWLFGIARNVVADDRRRRARELRAVSRLAGRRPLQPDALARARERIAPSASRGACMPPSTASPPPNGRSSSSSPSTGSSSPRPPRPSDCSRSPRGSGCTGPGSPCSPSSPHAAGLQRALAAKGITARVDYLPGAMVCAPVLPASV